MSELRMMATTGMLGYGYTEEAFRRGLSLKPDFIAADGGSMDPGPYYLGEGVPFVSRQAIKRDLGLMLEAGIENNIPVLIGSAGGGGSDPQVAIVREVAEEIAREKGLKFRMAVIHAEQPKDYLKKKRAEGLIRPLGPIAELTDDSIDDTHRVVGMMGVEPFQKALEDGAQVVIAGRATDASIYSAIPLMRGYDPGLVWHLAKIIECAGQVTTPRFGQDCVLGTLGDGYFLVEPGHPDKRCTRMRIAAHTLYENPSPYHLVEPDGTLVTTHSEYEQVDPRTVKVTGSRFEPANSYTVKLEGVRKTGFRTVFIAGVRDPVLISVIDDFVASCHDRVGNEAATLGIPRDSYRLNIRIYGKDATMGPREPMRDAVGHEIGLLVDVLADDEDTSKAIMAKARYALLHTDFPGRKCISGNLAIPFSPSDMPVGMTYGFNVWHTMELDDPLEPFPIEMVDV
jgi:Acyclic terpene utilisation family protein AtuA